ncbi:hypothetical protein V6N12_042568 [Hibiscus sabdariffa]|uniref:DUF4283 domain-containing protein n=1 Tax=Hibiscus sabdariffa TaxID=183260 RepID=A0ABR2EFL3_9ROSI
MNTEEDLYSLDDDGIDLLDDDVWFGEVDCIPFIKFFDRVQKLALKSLDLTLVVKFLVKFTARSEYLNVLKEGPWTIIGHYLIVESWSIDFSTLQSYPSCIMAWVCLTGLPITCYKHSLLKAIGFCIGSVVKIDFHSDNGSRGYNWLSMNLFPLFFVCGTYGHVQDLCLKSAPPVPDATLTDSFVSPPNRVLNLHPNLMDPGWLWRGIHDPSHADPTNVPHTHTTQVIDKASLSEHPGKTKTTTKNTTTTRETYEISLGSTSFPISPSSIVRPGGSHANRQSKNEGMGVFLNPNKHSAVTMAADGNPALPSNSLALIPNPKNARRSFVELGNPTTPSSVNVIFRRPSSPSGLLSESHHALDSSPNAHHTDDWVDMVD